MARQAMTETPPAVVIGAYANGTGVIRSLGREGIPVDVIRTLPADFGQTSRFARKSFDLMQISSDPNCLVGLLESHVDRWKGAVIVPTNDHALTGMAKNHARLSENFRLTCQPWNVVERVIDKSLTVSHAKDVGIRVPEVFGRATSAFEGAASLGYPVLVKPVEGHQFAHVFRTKLFMVHTPEELREVIGKVEAAGFACEIVQFIVGPETATHHFQVYIDANGHPHGAFTYRKLRQQPPVFGVAAACEPYDVPELHAPTLALLESIGWRGIASVAYKRDTRDGRHYLMEINGRSPLSHGLALRCGLNYAMMAYSEAVTGEVRGDNRNEWSGIWIHLHGDFFAIAKNFGKEGYGLRDVVRSYTRPKTFAVLSWRDPLPFLRQWWFSVKKAPRFLAERIGRLAKSSRPSDNVGRTRDLEKG